MKRLAKRKSYTRRTLGAALGFLAVIAFAVGSQIFLKRYCRAATPWVVVNHDAEDALRLAILYDAKDIGPFSEKDVWKMASFEGCDGIGEGLCIRPRTRLEFLFESKKYQRVQVRDISVAPNRIVGSVRWFGPAHPWMVEVRCSNDRKLSGKGCTLVRVFSEPDLDLTERFALDGKSRRDDICVQGFF